MDAGGHLKGWHCCPVCTGEVVNGVYLPNRDAYQFHLRTHIEGHFKGEFGLPKRTARLAKKWFKNELGRLFA